MRVLLLIILTACPLLAQPLVNVQTVLVGNPNNAPDKYYSRKQFGAVGYAYRIGKFEVTIEQYATFLNAVAQTNTNDYVIGLWRSSMRTDTRVAGIARSGSGTVGNPFIYSVVGSGNRPITYVSWFDAARFANWMHNGATNGASTETGAYTLNGAVSGIFLKNTEASWWIPSEDEWYKAAYHKKSSGTIANYWLYPTQSDAIPVAEANPPGGSNSANYGGVRSPTNLLTEVGAFTNSPSSYGTFDQGGSVYEWNDAVIDAGLMGNITFFRGLRGGQWGNPENDLRASWGAGNSLTYRNAETGFRMATAAQPARIFLSLEKTESLSGSWQLVPLSASMITTEGKLDAGLLTNTGSFYRLRIETVEQQ